MMRSFVRFICLAAPIALSTLAHADTLQFFWDGPTSFTFDIPSQLIVSDAVPGSSPIPGGVPCLFSGVATQCGVTFASGGVFPFPGLIVDAPILGNNALATVVGSGIVSFNYSSDLPVGVRYLNILTGDYSVQMNQIFSSLNDVNPGILSVTDLSIPSALPEPSTFALMSTGILGIVCAARRKFPRP